MATEIVTLKYNSRSVKARKALEELLLSGLFEKEESPYDPEFVAKIRKAEKEKSHKVDLSKYGLKA